MTTLDWIIVALVALFGLAGLRRGFIVGALSLGGLVAGAIVGARVGPLLLPEGSHSPYAPLFALAGALLLGGLLASGLERLGARLRNGLWIPGLGALDGLLGGLLSAAIALGLVWLAGAVVLQTPGLRDLRADVQRSFVLRQLNAVLPPSGPLLNALARFDPLPSIDGAGRRGRAALARGAARAGRARRRAERRADPRDGVRARRRGQRLGRRRRGGAGSSSRTRTSSRARTTRSCRRRATTAGSRDATLVHLDVRDDVAVLRVAGLAAPALALAERSRRGDRRRDPRLSAQRAVRRRGGRDRRDAHRASPRTPTAVGRCGAA